jgi:hypothetical protein
LGREKRRKPTIMNKSTPEFRSTLFDALIVLADVLVGGFLAPWFKGYAGDAGSGGKTMLLCGILLALTAMYAAGLLVNRVNFRAEQRIRISAWDNLALVFNMVLLAAIFPLVFMEVFPVGMNLAVVILLSVGFMAGWAWLHSFILDKESSRSGDRPSVRRKVVGFFLVVPFVACLSLPVGVLAEGMNLYARGEPVTLANAVAYPLFAGTLLALVAWFLYFIPRKMLKGFMGVNIRSRYFLWALVFDYALRLSSLTNSRW